MLGAGEKKREKRKKGGNAAPWVKIVSAFEGKKERKREKGGGGGIRALRLSFHLGGKGKRRERLIELAGHCKMPREKGKKKKVFPAGERWESLSIIWLREFS